MKHPIYNLLPQHPQHYPPEILHLPGPRHSRRSSTIPARARTAGRADEVLMAPEGCKVARGYDWIRDQGSARQAGELRCPCSGRDPQGGQLASRPGCGPSFSSMPPRHTALWVCCKSSLRGAKGRGQDRCQAQPNQAGQKTLAHSSFLHGPLSHSSPAQPSPSIPNPWLQAQALPFKVPLECS